MKILLIPSSFNGITQRLWLELDRLDYQVKIYVAADDIAMMKATETFQSDLIKEFPAGLPRGLFIFC